MQDKARLFGDHGMTISIQLPEDDEQVVNELATRAGMSVDAYVLSLVLRDTQTAKRTRNTPPAQSREVAGRIAPDELRRRLQKLASSHAPAPALTDEQLRRENIYGDERAA